MKRHIISIILIILSAASCDIFKDEIDALRNDLQGLQEQVDRMNNQLTSLQGLMEAINQQALIEDVTPIKEGDIETGYVIRFSKGDPITIYHGTDGKNGHSPVVSVAQHNDGKWYWTIDGEWMKDGKGNMIQSAAEDGKDGKTPQLKIEDEMWYLSYDNGQTWVKTGKAQGDKGGNGKDGISVFKSVDYITNSNYVVFTLMDGTELKLHTWSVFVAAEDLCSQLNNNIASLDMIISRKSSGEPVKGYTISYDGNGKTAFELTYVSNSRIILYQDTPSATPEGESRTPIISLKESNGTLCWTLNGEIMKDSSGSPIPAAGEITPKLLVKDNRWMLSLDNRDSWTDLGPISEFDMDEMIRSIDNTADELQYILTLAGDASIGIPKYQKINLVWSQKDDILIKAGQSVDISYSIEGGWGEAYVSTMATNGWQATIDMTDDKHGVITVTAPYPYTQNEVTLFINCDGQIIMEPLTFMEEKVAVDSLRICRPELQIYNKYSSTLTATVYPETANDREVVWTSSEPTIVAVGKNGRISALNTGTASIYATASDKTDSCIVTVIEPDIKVSSVEINTTKVTMEERRSLKLWASILPTNATYTNLFWESTNPEIASVVNDSTGTVLAHRPGKAVITVKAGELEKACEVTVTESTVTYDVDDDGINPSYIDVPVGDSDVTFRMILVNSGSFIMGNDEGEENQMPAHQVTLTNDYYISETEVTQELFLTVMGSLPDQRYSDDSSRPVVYFPDWYDYDIFFEKLNTLTGYRFRLPTEAEWEFAARGGRLSQGYLYSGSNDLNEVGWYSDNSKEGYVNATTGFSEHQTHPVRSKRPNELGIYDMSGNASEICSDWYGIYPSEAVTDPVGYVYVNDQSRRVRRGGGGSFGEWEQRVTHRKANEGWYDEQFWGLRLAL